MPDPSNPFNFSSVADALSFCDYSIRFGSSDELRTLFRSFSSVIKRLSADVERLTMERERSEAKAASKGER